MARDKKNVLINKGMKERLNKKYWKYFKIRVSKWADMLVWEGKKEKCLNVFCFCLVDVSWNEKKKIDKMTFLRCMCQMECVEMSRPNTSTNH